MDEKSKNSNEALELTLSDSFENLCRAWLRGISMASKESTFSKYWTITERHIIPELGDIAIRDITQSLLEKYFTAKKCNGRIDGKGSLSANTLRMISSILHSIMQYSTRRGIWEFNNIYLTKPRLISKELSLFSLDEQKKLETYLLDQKELPAYGIYLTLYTGLRLGELCALTWKEIDVANENLNIKKTLQRIQQNPLFPCQNADSFCSSNSKTKIIIDTPKSHTSTRNIPIAPNLLAMLRLLQSQYSEDSYFLTGKEKQFMDPRTYQKKFHRFLKECDLSPRNFHVLRHQFASNCIACGIDPKTLSEFLGHTNVNLTLNRYVHSDDELKRKQMKKLELLHK